MKLLIALTGLLCGLFVGAGALLFNPLSQAATEPGPGASVFDIAPLEFHGAELDHITLLGLPGARAGRPFMAESLETANATVFVLRTPGGGAAALAARLSAADKHSRLLHGDAGVTTYTNIFFPNYGSVFLNGRENRWPIVRSGVLRLLGQPGEMLWPVSSRVNDGAPSGFVGGSGGLESMGGRYTESLRLSTTDDGTFSSEIALEPAAR